MYSIEHFPESGKLRVDFSKKYALSVDLFVSTLLLSQKNYKFLLMPMHHNYIFKYVNII